MIPAQRTETYLTRALRDGHATLEGPTNSERIRYVAVDRSEVFADPEEQVRAEFWAELIYRYDYPPDHLGIEITVPDRTPRDAADIVVFHDKERKQPFAVIECKRDGITDSEFEQAVEQAAGNGTWAKFRADFIGVVAGLTRRFLDFSPRYGVLERDANIVADLPSAFGRPQEFKYTKNGRLDLRPVNQTELIVTLRKSHQSLWGGGKLSPPAAFGELCKLVFMKVHDERQARLDGAPYEFQTKTYETDAALAKRMGVLYSSHRAKDPDVFTDEIRIDDRTLRTLVSHLESISLSQTDIDVKGLAFETFMDSFFKGDFGQYFTPREVVDFAVGMIDPRQDERVIDPACGSGGFLLHALHHVRNTAHDFYRPEQVEFDRYWRDFAHRNLFGVEINEEIARVAKMNMILHDDGHTNIISDDALEPLGSWAKIHPDFKEASFDVVITNPPFGAQVNLSERPYLSTFELGRKPGGAGTRRSQKSEVLFVERIHDLLKPGGRAAVVFPDGILSNSTLQYVRDFMFEKFEIKAVVSLPVTAFSFYGAAVKSSVVVLHRLKTGEHPPKNQRVFMAEADSVGYDATGRETKNDLPEVLTAYRRFVSDPSSLPLIEA